MPLKGYPPPGERFVFACCSRGTLAVLPWWPCNGGITGALATSWVGVRGVGDARPIDQLANPAMPINEAGALMSVSFADGRPQAGQWSARLQFQA
jgi:hypothetical protein